MTPPTHSEELIRTVMMKDPACRSAAAVVLGSPCYQAQMLHRAARWCRLQGWPGLGGLCSTIGRMLSGIDIDPTAKIGRRVFMRSGLGAVIGAGVEVGDDCEIGAFVVVEGDPKRGAAPVLEPGVVVGAGARIAGALRIAAGAVVPANAVVTADFPPPAATVAEAAPQNVPDAPNTAELERLAAEAEKRVADFDAQVDAGRASERR